MDDIEQADRREQLVAAIGRLPLDRLETRESLGVCTAYFDKQKSSIDILRFPGLQLVERQATDCGDELLAAVGLIEAVHPNLRGSPCERAAGRRDDPVRWSANRAAFVVFGAFDARPYSKRPWRGL